VSVVVPARNEEVNLRACLESLIAQNGITFEIIVVDDGSTDRTREIALSFSGVQAVDAGHLPQGWTGKNHAVWVGAQAAQGEWLLFTDADTVHASGSMARAIAEARQKKAFLLSYSPEQEAHGFWQKALMPVIFAELARTYPPSLVSDPKTKIAAANGQYLLVTREAYDAVGGHAAIAGNLLEDVAIARAVKASGRKVFFRFGGDAVRTHMYRNFAQMKEGWTKNLALLFPSPGQLATLRFIEFVLIGGLGICAAVAASERRVPASLVSGTLAGVLASMFVMRIRKAHFSWEPTLFSFAGLPVFSYLLLRSKMLHKQGGVSWKGRTYRAMRDVDSEGLLSRQGLPAGSRLTLNSNE